MLTSFSEILTFAGWDKPIVDTFQREGGWTFSVKLSRYNKKTSQKDVVKLEPHPPYICPSALEARHWGATYALYRVCHYLPICLECTYVHALCSFAMEYSLTACCLLVRGITGTLLLLNTRLHPSISNGCIQMIPSKPRKRSRNGKPRPTRSERPPSTLPTMQGVLDTVVRPPSTITVYQK